jgi:5-methylcytosine-specific restriction endonuclease McrA
MSITAPEVLREKDSMPFTDLSKLSDKDLLKSLAKAVDGEIDQTTLVLRHLILIEERKLHARNHDSLFAFLTEKYRYSANAAQRRIDAARMLREFPLLEPKIQSRAHSLTNLSLVRSLFRQEKKRKTPFSHEKKLEILTAIEGKSTRDAYVSLLTQSSAPELLKKCKSTVRALGNGYTAFKIVTHEELTADLYRIRDLWAHAVPDGNWTEIMRRMVKLTLDSIDPLKKAERAKSRKERSQARKNDTQATQDPKQVRNNFQREHSCELRTQKEPVNEDHSARSGRSTTGDGSADGVHLSTDTHSRPLATTQADTPIGFDRETGEVQNCLHLDDPLEPHALDRRRPLAASIRQAVDLRDRADGCTHIDEYGNRCGSHHSLEYDHIIRYALGGPDTVENVRLLCREHNSFHSYQIFRQAAQRWRAGKAQEF